MASADPGSAAYPRSTLVESSEESQQSHDLADRTGAADASQLSPQDACDIWWAARCLDPSKLQEHLRDIHAEEIAGIFEHGLSVVQSLFAAFYHPKYYLSPKGVPKIGWGYSVLKDLFEIATAGDADQKDATPFVCDTAAEVVMRAGHDANATGADLGSPISASSGAGSAVSSTSSTSIPGPQPSILADKDGTIFMTMEEAKRRFSACLDILVEALGGVESSEFKTAIDLEPLDHKPRDQPEYGGMPPHPVMLALGRNLPGAAHLIRAVSLDTTSGWYIESDRTVEPRSGFGMTFLWLAQLPCSSHGLHILAARSGNVEALRAMAECGIPAKTRGWTVLYEACYQSQVEVLRYAIDELGMDPRTSTIKDGKIPFDHSLAAPGTGAFDLLVDEYGFGDQLEADGPGMLSRAIEDCKQLALSLIRRGVPHDTEAMEADSLGKNLAIIAVSCDNGTQAALDVILEGTRARVLVLEALRKPPGTYRSCRRVDMWGMLQNENHRDMRAINRSEFAGMWLVERGLTGPETLGKLAIQLRATWALDAAVKHGFEPSRADISRVLRQYLNSLKYMGGSAEDWYRFYRKFSQLEAVREFMMHATIADPDDPALPDAPAAACTAAIIAEVALRGSSSPAKIRAIRSWIPPGLGANLSFAASVGQMDALDPRTSEWSEAHKSRQQFPTRVQQYTPLARAILRREPELAAYLLLRGARLHPIHDACSREELDSLFYRSRWATRPQNPFEQNLIDCLVTHDTERLRELLLCSSGFDPILGRVKAILGGNLKRQLAIAGWRRAGLVQLWAGSAWKWAREGNMRGLRKSIKVGSRAGALQQTQSMSVESGEAAAASSAGGKYHSAQYGQNVPTADPGGHASAKGAAASSKLSHGPFTSDGCTVLMAGAAGGNAEIVKLLLALGADPSVTSADGATAGVWAERAGAADCAALLHEAEATRDRLVNRRDEASSLIDLSRLREAGIKDQIRMLRRELRRTREVALMAAEDRRSAGWAYNRSVMVTHGPAASSALVGEGRGTARVGVTSAFGSGAAGGHGLSDRRAAIAVLEELDVGGGAPLCESAGVPRLAPSKGAKMVLGPSEIRAYNAQMREMRLHATSPWGYRGAQIKPLQREPLVLPSKPRKRAGDGKEGI